MLYSYTRSIGMIYNNFFSLFIFFFLICNENSYGFCVHRIFVRYIREYSALLYKPLTNYKVFLRTNLTHKNKQDFNISNFPWIMDPIVRFLNHFN